MLNACLKSNIPDPFSDFDLKIVILYWLPRAISWNKRKKKKETFFLVSGSWKVTLFNLAYTLYIIQPNQINMAVLFWYPIKSNASVRYTTEAYTGQVTLYKVPETHCYVRLVTLYKEHIYLIAIVFYVNAPRTVCQFWNHNNLIKYKKNNIIKRIFQ